MVKFCSVLRIEETWGDVGRWLTSMIPVLGPQSFFVTIAAFGAIGEDDSLGP